MPWNNDIYYYTQGILRAIAEQYDLLYSDGLLLLNHRIDDLYLVAEYKADFDMALSAIGRGSWRGLTGLYFKDYKHFGRLQRIVIADILGIPDGELERLGFYDLLRLSGTAYAWMCRVLNGKQLPMAKARVTRWDIDDTPRQYGVTTWRQGFRIHYPPYSRSGDGSWDNAVKVFEEKS